MKSRYNLFINDVINEKLNKHFSFDKLDIF